tara:strand:+ start:177 stop:371 length:195 start_codon:yes stop_codon:yes gene_type:complete
MLLPISDYLCDPFDEEDHWAVLLKMAANDFAEIILDSDGEIRIMASREQLQNFLETDVDDFIDL